MRYAPPAIGLSIWTLLALPCCSTPEQPDASAHVTTTPTPRTGRRMERHELINTRVRASKPDLIFVGDSITERWEREGSEIWETYYSTRNAANLGIGGDRTQHVLWRLENGNIDGISPKLAVVMIGTNNSGDNTPKQIADGISAILRKLRSDLPTTEILLLAIFPRGENDQNARRETNSRANAIIAGLADGEMVHYLDIGPSFLEADYALSRDVMPDLLHLSEEGYEIWAASIEPAVARILER